MRESRTSGSVRGTGATRFPTATPSLANLLIQLGQLRLVRRSTFGGPSLPARKQRTNPLNQCLFPRINLAGIPPIPAR